MDTMATPSPRRKSRRSSDVSSPNSNTRRQSDGVSPRRSDSWADYTLLKHMQEVAEFNDIAISHLDHLEDIVQDVDCTCADLASRREKLERELLDWKNLLVQKVEGCYTRVLGQLLEAFDRVETETALKREYTSNLLWSSRQLCQTATETLNSPDLDSLVQIKNRLETKIDHVESLQSEALQSREDISDWRYTRPEVDDDIIWRLMGNFEFGQYTEDSCSVTPVTTPCQENGNFITIGFTPEICGTSRQKENTITDTGIPIVNISNDMDENLNERSPHIVITDPSDTDPRSPKLINAFQTKTLTDKGRCHPLSFVIMGDKSFAVPDKHNRKIKIFSENGELSREITHDNLRAPAYIALTPDGDLAVCDRKAGDIKVFTKEGECLAVVPKLFKSPAGIAFTSSGDLIVADTGRRAVHVVALQAATVKSTYRHFTAPVLGTACKEVEVTQLQWPHHLTVTNDDVIVVSDRMGDALQMLDTSGRGMGRYGTSGTGKGRLQGPYGTAVSSDGDLLVADYGNHSVQLLESGGQWNEALLTSQHGLQFPSAVCWIGSDSVAVSEYLSGIIKVFRLPDREGEIESRPFSPAF